MQKRKFYSIQKIVVFHKPGKNIKLLLNNHDSIFIQCEELFTSGSTKNSSQSLQKGTYHRVHSRVRPCSAQGTSPNMSYISYSALVNMVMVIKVQLQNVQTNLVSGFEDLDLCSCRTCSSLIYEVDLIFQLVFCVFIICK